MSFDFAAIIADHQKHLAECTKRPCATCSRDRCPRCQSDMVLPGAVREIDGESVQLKMCEPCADAEVVRRRARDVLSSIPASFRWARLGVPELKKRVGATSVQIKRAYDSVVEGRPIVIVGEPGSGKTSLGVALLRSLVERGLRKGAPEIEVRRALSAGFFSAYDLARDRARHKLGEGEAPLVEDAMLARVALLDDIGSEPEGQLSAVTDVIYTRHAHGLPTWITTWMTQEDATRRYGGGISRRIFERAEAITLVKVA